MKNQIVTLIQHSLFCTLLLSTTVMAMEPDEYKDLSSTVKKMSLNYPVPPMVTYQDYVSNLIFEDGKMGRWGSPKGNLAGWLQSTANKKRLEDLDGTPLEDFPLFQATLNPVVDGKRLRCDYSLPAANSDLSKGSTTFSLFCDDTTSEEIEEAKKLHSESISDYTTRLLEWQEMLRIRQQVSQAVMSHLVGEKFIPGIHNLLSRTEEITLKGSLLDSRNDKHLMYFNFDYATMHLKTHRGFLEQYEPNLKGMTLNEIMQCRKQRDVSMPQTEEGPFDYLYSNQGIRLNQDVDLAHLLLQGNGPLVFQSQTISLDNVLLWPVGDLFLQSVNQACPIDQIEITACNSTKPIFAWGKVNFNEVPTVQLETINAALINLKFRDQK